MRTTHFILLFFIIVPACWGQSTLAADNLQAEMVAAFKAGKWDVAADIGRKLAIANEKEFGPRSVETGRAYAWLGMIYKSAKEWKESEAYFLRSIEIFAPLTPRYSDELKLIYEHLAEAYSVREKYGKARKTFEKAIEVGFVAYGETSIENYYNLINAAKLNARDQKFEKATEFLSKAHAVAGKLDDAEKRTRVDDIRVCLSASYPEFEKAYLDQKADTADSPLNKGVVNGEAILLARPTYPRGARGTTGSVVVRIIIDESGNVVESQAVCGPSIFLGSVLEAARRSKFKPTTLNGEGVRVSGYITYNFESQ